MSQGGSSGVRLLVRPIGSACVALPVPRQACAALARAALAVPFRAAVGPHGEVAGGAASFAPGAVPSSWLSAAEAGIADQLAGPLRSQRGEPCLSVPGPTESAANAATAEALVACWWHLLPAGAAGREQVETGQGSGRGSDGAAWARVRPGVCRPGGVPLWSLARDLVAGPLPAAVIDVDEASWGAWASRSPATADPISQGLAWGERLVRGDLPAARVPGALPLSPEGGEVLGAVRLAADHLRLTLAFQEALGEARLDAIRELAYGAGHEINNPLANIATRAQTLLLDERDPERRRRLSTIVDQAFRARDLIGGLMLFARPPRPNGARTDVHGMISAVVDLLAPAAAQRRARLEYTPPALQVSVAVDRAQIEEALRAIVGNALEAIEEGGRVTVTVSAGARPGGCDIVVADDGPGIDATTLRRVFDPFFSGREAGRGAGFGLSKAWRFVESNGGAIEIESRVGRGTRVIVSFPVWQVGGLPAVDAAVLPGGAQAGRESSLSFPGRPDSGGERGKVAAESPA